METEKTHLNREENEMLRELLRPGVAIEAVIPDEASAQDLWRTLDACTRGLGLLESRIYRLKPIVGRILLLFENKPSLYKELGYETYSEFMSRGVFDKLGLHRTSAYEGKLVARDWPQLGPDRYAKIGPKKLNILSKFTNGKGPNAEMWLRTAERMKNSEFRQYVEQRGFLQPGETIGATIVIQTNQTVYNHFKEFFADGRVHSKVDSKDHGRIFEAMLQECSGSWLAIEDDKERARHAVTSRTGT